MLVWLRVFELIFVISFPVRGELPTNFHGDKQTPTELLQGRDSSVVTDDQRLPNSRAREVGIEGVNAKMRLNWELQPAPLELGNLDELPLTSLPATQRDEQQRGSSTRPFLGTRTEDGPSLSKRIARQGRKALDKMSRAKSRPSLQFEVNRSKNKRFGNYDTDVASISQAPSYSNSKLLSLGSIPEKLPKWIGRRRSKFEEAQELHNFSPGPPFDEHSDGEEISAYEERSFRQRSSIRHRKSRKTFVRSRKSPKRPHVYNDDASSLPQADHSVVQVLASTFRNSDKAERFSALTPSSSVTASDDENLLITSEKLLLDDQSSGFENDTGQDFTSGVQPLDDGLDKMAELEYPDLWETEDSEHSVDVVTKFLRIIESQSMSVNCSKGTKVKLGEGVVDRYAQERFRLEAEVAVNRANLYTRLWKYSREQVLASEYLLHAEVMSLAEFDEDIFAAGNCYDLYEYPGYELFCPFAHRLPDGNILAKDLALQYFYLTNGSEWFLDAKRSAERVIQNYSQITKGYHSFTRNLSSQPEPMEDEILSVRYEDGIWSEPYYDCGGGNIWMLTYTVPFFGYQDGRYHFKGTSGIDIDLRRVDIDQCPLPPESKALNIFAASDKCKKRTTKCVSLPGLGFRRGSYKCVCRDGFYFPDTSTREKFFNGSIIEEEYEKKLSKQVSMYDDPGSFECLSCAAGCDTCDDSRPCVVTLNWLMRSAVLALALALIACLPAIAFLTWKYGNVKVVRAASPALLRYIILGALFIYSTTVVLYPLPTAVTCSLRVWLREIGFSLTYGALMLKTWRISVVFRVRSAKAVKITDLDLLKRLWLIVAGFSAFVAVRTIVAPPHVIVSYTTEGLKAYLCSTDWWDHVFTAMEMLFLVWGIRLCIVVRKAPSEFNESKFISMAIYNEFLLTLFLNVSMLFLRSPANPDLLFIIYFCHTQLTITLLLALIFGSKAYMVVKGQGKGEETSMKAVTAGKLHHKSKNSAAYHASLSSCHGGTVTETDVQEEFHRVYMQLEALKERNALLNNRHLVACISAMQEAAASTAITTTFIATSNHDCNTKTDFPLSDDKTSFPPDNTRIGFIPDPSASPALRDESRENKSSRLDGDGSPGHVDGGSKNNFIDAESMNFGCQVGPNGRPRTENTEVNLFKHGFREKSKSAIVRRRSQRSSSISFARTSLFRCKSSTEGKISEGIVMRPIINTIWPCTMTTNSSLGCGPPGKNAISDPQMSGTSLAAPEIMPPIGWIDCDANVQTSNPSLVVSKEMSTQTSNTDRFLSSFTPFKLHRMARKVSLSDLRWRSSEGSDLSKPVCCSNSSFRLNLPAQPDGLRSHFESRKPFRAFRLWRSLNNVNELEGFFNPEKQSNESYSIALTPSQLECCVASTGGSDEARAFVLSNLSDKIKVSATEVTV